MTQGRDVLRCPECGQWVPHTKGYLDEHSKNIQRGELVTGQTFCDGSNTKPPANLKTVTFTGMCMNCISTVRKEFKETYPGSLDQYGGVLTVQCPECGPEGDYCSLCDHQVHEDKKAGEQLGDTQADIQAEIVDLMGQIQNHGADPVATMEKIGKLQSQLTLVACDECAGTGVDPTSGDPCDMCGGGGQLAASQVTGPVWVDEDGDPFCPDGQGHQIVHRQQEDRPVLLTDNHVIVEGIDEDPVPGGQS